MDNFTKAFFAVILLLIIASIRYIFKKRNKKAFFEKINQNPFRLKELKPNEFDVPFQTNFQDVFKVLKGIQIDSESNTNDGVSNPVRINDIKLLTNNSIFILYKGFVNMDTSISVYPNVKSVPAYAAIIETTNNKISIYGKPQRSFQRLNYDDELYNLILSNLSALYSIPLTNGGDIRIEYDVPKYKITNKIEKKSVIRGLITIYTIEYADGEVGEVYFEEKNNKAHFKDKKTYAWTTLKHYYESLDSCIKALHYFLSSGKKLTNGHLGSH